MKVKGHDFDVTYARTGFVDVSSVIARRLLAPLHRGKFLESCRDFALAASPAWRTEKAEWAARNQALIASIAATANARYVVDSSKTAVRLKLLRQIPDLKVKVIRLLRDGRAVSLTYMDSDSYADAAEPSLRGGGTGKARSERLSMIDAASRWYRSNVEADNVFATVPDSDRIKISYEDLCTNTPGVLSTIHKNLGLQPDSSYTTFRNAVHHVIGNGMRLDESSEVRLDDRWRDVLTDSDLKHFNRVGGALNRQYGYE